MIMPKRVNLLTPLEKQRAEEQAYAAFLEKMKLYSPPEEPTTTDLVSDNRRVMDWLVKAVGWLPLILAIIGLAAAVVSMDKTSAATLRELNKGFSPNWYPVRMPDGQWMLRVEIPDVVKRGPAWPPTPMTSPATPRMSCGRRRAA
jgi:hypothetical protein